MVYSRHTRLPFDGGDQDGYCLSVEQEAAAFLIAPPCFSEGLGGVLIELGGWQAHADVADHLDLEGGALAGNADVVHKGVIRGDEESGHSTFKGRKLSCSPINGIEVFNSVFDQVHLEGQEVELEDVDELADV